MAVHYRRNEKGEHGNEARSKMNKKNNKALSQSPLSTGEFDGIP